MAGRKARPKEPARLGRRKKMAVRQRLFGGRRSLMSTAMMIMREVKAP